MQIISDILYNKIPRRKMNSSSSSLNAGFIKEMFQLHQLYTRIIHSYSQRLLQELHSHQPLKMSEQQARTYIEAIKYYLNNQFTVYDAVVSTRESGLPPKKKESDSSYSGYKTGDIDFAQLSHSSESPAHKDQLFNFDFSSKMLAKGEQQIKEKGVRQDSQSSSSSSQSQIGAQEYVEKAQRQTSYLIFGAFSRQNLKRYVKKEKIVLYLDDMFVKCCANGRDAYFSKSVIELKKIQKEHANLS